MPNSARQDLLIATSNAGKIAEFRSLLAVLGVRLRTLGEFPEIDQVQETGATFVENAVLKASGYARQSGLWTLADDSGLKVDALNGAPGVFSARFGGAGASDAQRIERLLEELTLHPLGARSARFVCVIAIADELGEIRNISRGSCGGDISASSQGAEGFGYDPIFRPHGFDQTLGELPPEVKLRISHRALAVKAAHPFLFAHF